MPEEPPLLKSTSSRWVDASLLICLATSLLGNVVLGWRLKANPAQSLGISTVEASVGRIVPNLRVLDLAGKPQEIDFSKGRTVVLYVFRPGCEWCEANLERVRALAEARKDNFRFIGLSTTAEGLPPYLVTHSLPFPVFVVANNSELSQLNVVATPQTIEVSTDGRIAQNWVGTAAYKENSAIEHHFAVSLLGEDGGR